MAQRPAHLGPTQATERGAALALLPIAATLGYYLLPLSLQELPLVQFTPQILAYLALALWATYNRPVVARLGLDTAGLRNGLWWAVLVGVVLGALNTLVILKIVPALGYDIMFLKDTPHAHIPPFIMVPWLNTK